MKFTFLILAFVALLAAFIVPALRAGKTGLHLRVAASLFVGGLRHQFSTANANPGLANVIGNKYSKLTDAAIARYLLVKVGTDNDHVAVAGATDVPTGVTDDSATAAEASINIRALGKDVKKILTAGEAMATIGVPVFAGAGGKVMLAGTVRIGYLETTAAADGDTVCVNDQYPGVSGFTTGGGTVTQATSKSTGVTLSKVCGDITLNNAALASLAIASFTLTNTLIAAGDQLTVTHQSGGTVGAYLINVQSAAGSAVINVTNITGGSLSEAPVLRFQLHKGVTA